MGCQILLEKFSLGFSLLKKNIFMSPHIYALLYLLCTSLKKEEKSPIKVIKSSINVFGGI